MPIDQAQRDFLREYYLRTRLIRFKRENEENGMSKEDAAWTAEQQLAAWSQPLQLPK